MPPARPPLFTAYFFVMCGFSFTVFFSVFFLLPTVPFHILDMGGTKAAAGLFLGFLTYASAFSAPLTGALADRVGKRRMLIVCSLVIAAIAWSLQEQRPPGGWGHGGFFTRGLLEWRVLLLAVTLFLYSFGYGG